MLFIIIVYHYCCEQRAKCCHWCLYIYDLLKSCVTLCQDKDSLAEERTRQAVSMAKRIAGEDTIFAARAMLCLADVLDSIPGNAFPLLLKRVSRVVFIVLDISMMIIC